MGIFSIFGKRKVKVNVFGSDSLSAGADGRYSKQAHQNKKSEKKKMKEIEFEPHTPKELQAYVVKQYGAVEVERTDARYKKAYMNVKSHLVFTYAPELLSTKAMKKPNHAPVSEHDPDYEAFYANEKARWKEAVMVKPEDFEMHLHMYHIPVFQGETPVSWVEVLIESKYSYLSFEIIDLEYPDHYKTKQIVADIVKFFGASKEDKKAKNDRYQQLARIQVQSK